MGVILNSPKQAPSGHYLPKPTDKDEVYDRIRDDISSVTEHFDAKLLKRTENFNFYRGNQWNAEEIKEHLTQMRKPYVFNEIQNKVDHVIGSQTQTRLDAKAMPREKGDETGAELLTNLVKWVEQLNNFEYTETDIFLEGIVGAAGFSQVRWGKEEIQHGYPIIEKVPAEQMVWDVINCKKMDLSDSRWVARRMVMSKMDAVEQFPTHAQEVEDAQLDNELISNDFVKYSYGSTDAIEGRKLISVILYYERVKEFKYTVSDDIRNEDREFDTEAEANAYFDGLMDEYTKTEEVLMMTDGTPRVAVISDLVDAIYQAVVIGKEVVEYEKTSLPFFPYDGFFCYWSDGDYWAFVDSLIDPQRLVNTFFSQWEYQLGAAGKNITTVVKALVGPNGTEMVRSELSRTAPVIELKSHDAMKIWPNNPVNPELYQGIMFGINRMMDYAGGKNALGLQENAAESGRAVIARAEQGGLARLPFFDRLRLWRINVTLKIVWYLKNFMSPGQIIRVIGDDSDIAFIPLDDQLLNTLREIKVDIIIDEAIKSDSVRERQFHEMKELFSQTPGIPPEVAVSTMIEFSSLPQSKKESLLSQLKFYQEWQQQQAEAQKQQKMQQEVLDAVQKKRLKDIVQQQEQLGNAEEELDKQKENVQTKLDDVEKARMAMMEQNMTPTQQGQIQDTFNNKQELGQSRGLPSQTAMLK